ncbi:hypothetical protein GGR56DRAFT_129895 [Xylariaceae sp. FL0804]|nr:hypothetical protein GGR56DRAFT_129895 [Xylariaceae sp. FL0804]
MTWAKTTTYLEDPSPTTRMLDTGKPNSQLIPSSPTMMLIPQASPPLGSWPDYIQQQQQVQAYPIMHDNSFGLVQQVPRPTGGPPQPMMASGFVDMPCLMPPAETMQQYPPQAMFGYSPCTPGTSSSYVGSPNQPQASGPPAHVVTPVNVNARMDYGGEARRSPAQKFSSSPLIKQEAEPQTELFDTAIPDKMAEESKEPSPITGLLLMYEKHIDVKATSSPDNSPSAAVSKSAKKGNRVKKAKRFPCDWEGCGKAFGHSASLKTHMRSHTGKKPFECPFRCGKWFSQTGNRTTHVNRHKKHYPYKCPFPGCSRAFPAKGGLAPHMKTHLKEEERKFFFCALGSCQNHRFTTRGNLKQHQDKYHKEAIHDLKRRFSSLTSIDSVSEADRQLLMSLYDVHKDSIKGIKGRGHGRTVDDRRSTVIDRRAIVTNTNAATAAQDARTPLPLLPQPMMQQQHHHHHHHHLNHQQQTPPQQQYRGVWGDEYGGGGAPRNAAGLAYYGAVSPYASTPTLYAESDQTSVSSRTGTPCSSPATVVGVGEYGHHGLPGVSYPARSY